MQDPYVAVGAVQAREAIGALGVEPLLRFAPRKNQKRAINEKGP